MTSPKKNQQTVRDAIEKIGGTFLRIDMNGHGPVAVFTDRNGREWSYGFDKTPKAAYTLHGTLKGIRHAMLGKAATRGLTSEQVYVLTTPLHC
jgi:hypothetical protein